MFYVYMCVKNILCTFPVFMYGYVTQIQADSFISDMNGFLFFLISGFGPWRHEERDTILKSLR